MVDEREEIATLVLFETTIVEKIAIFCWNHSPRIVVWIVVHVGRKDGGEPSPQASLTENMPAFETNLVLG